MGNIPTTYTSVFTQCIRRRNSQQLINIDSDSDFDDDEKIIFYNREAENREAAVIRKDDSLKKKKKIPRAAIPHTSLNDH